jgi:hypothetical protein
MKTHVEFRSDQFPPYEGEEHEVNPGLYGKRLAEFLVRELAPKDFEPLAPIAEDWGWLIPIKNDGFRLWIGCANDERADGFLCFIEPHQPAIRKFPFLRTTDTSRRVGQLQQALDEILAAEPSVREQRWWTYEEFLNPPPRDTVERPNGHGLNRRQQR